MNIDIEEFKKYAQHLPKCKSMQIIDGKLVISQCTCGLDSLIAEAEKPTKTENQMLIEEMEAYHKPEPASEAAKFVKNLRIRMKDLENKYFNGNIDFGRFIELADIFFVQQNVEACLLKITEQSKEIEKHKKAVADLVEHGQKDQIVIFDLKSENKTWQLRIEEAGNIIDKLEAENAKLKEKLNNFCNDCVYGLKVNPKE